jgi:hypothetical protein
MANCTSESVSRSIIPVIPAISTYTVNFTGPVAVVPVSDSSPNISCILAVGTWNVLIEARNDTGVLIAEGTAENIIITAGGTTLRTIPLHAVGTGYGTIALTLAWPSLYSSISAVEAFLDDKAIAPANLTFNPVARTVVYNAYLPVGDYRLTFHLSRPGEMTPVYEAVHVYGNLISQASLILTADDFTNPPIAPSGLTVTVGTDRLNLSWADNSIIVETYSIERSLDGSTWTVLVSGLAHVVTDYEDDSLVVGSTYHYRVIAHNQIGSSPPSASASALFTAPGDLTITITVSNPIDEPITFNQSSDIIVSRGGNLLLSVAESFTSYEWVLDGVTVGTAATLTHPCAALSLGVHHLALFVTKNELLYSNQFRFTVSN